MPFSREKPVFAGARGVDGFLAFGRRRRKNAGAFTKAPGNALVAAGGKTNSSAPKKNTRLKFFLKKPGAFETAPENFAADAAKNRAWA